MAMSVTKNKEKGREREKNSFFTFSIQISFIFKTKKKEKKKYTYSTTIVDGSRRRISTPLGRLSTSTYIQPSSLWERNFSFCFFFLFFLKMINRFWLRATKLNHDFSILCWNESVAVALTLFPTIQQFYLFWIIYKSPTQTRGHTNANWNKYKSNNRTSILQTKQ